MSDNKDFWQFDRQFASILFFYYVLDTNQHGDRFQVIMNDVRCDVIT